MKAEILILLGLLFAGLGTFLFWYGSRLWGKERESSTGELATPEIDFQRPFEVYFGSNVITAHLNDSSEGVDLRKLVAYGDYQYPVQIRFQNGNLLVSADIRNENNETIAKIVDNQWTINQDRMIARDRNYNDYAFEVIDSDLIPVLQVYLREQNTIYVGGLFRFPDGLILVTPNGLTINPSPESIDSFIKPIFKYPSERFLGQMSDGGFFDSILGMFVAVFGVATLCFCVLLFLRGRI